ncbi:MAG: type II secretion system GspH family protein [Gammaproteobacteria bacterium]|nr:type II secretion system GspH family protein [Gammaproteobacteria bacterium]
MHESHRPIGRPSTGSSPGAGVRIGAWSRNANRSRGFTLLEIAIVLVVIGVILAIGASTVPWLNEKQSLERTRGLMTEAGEAVLAFSLTNNRLPCPADPALSFGDAGFGTEDCSLATGSVPHEALLLPAPVFDSAHRAITYAVYRNAGIQADLATVTNLFDGLDEPVPVLNVSDFCQALQNGDPAAGTGFASTSTIITAGGCAAANFLNQAFVLSSAGLEDADGDTNPFDGLNVDGIATCFASPLQGRDASYDDLVRAVSFSTLLGTVCP